MICGQGEEINVTQFDDVAITESRREERNKSSVIRIFARTNSNSKQVMGRLIKRKTKETKPIASQG